MLTVLVFGSHNDPHAWELGKELRTRFPDFRFLDTNNPQDVLEAKGDVCIVDVVAGIDKPQLITVDQLKERKLYTAHDFDLGYFLKLLKGSGMISDFRIIGIPKEWDGKTVQEVSELLRG